MSRAVHVLFAAALCAGAGAHAQTRTAWQMHRGEGLVPYPAPFERHGDPGEYAFARIPFASDPGWGAAPDPDRINFVTRSTLCETRHACRAAGEFTYFRAVICVPDPRDLSSVSVRLGMVDDGARVTVFNSRFPAGITPDNGFASLGGGSVASGDFATSLRVGEPNTLIITHVDDCCEESFLRDVTVLANGRPLAATAPRESCNGLDDDCNGAADENLGSTTCGVGACVATTPNCLRGVAQRCVPGAPSAEVCDGVDNDCDGTTDEDLGAATCGLGACRVTAPNCVRGRPNVCAPGAPREEVCNGFDDDCDGVVDDAPDGGLLDCEARCHDPSCDPDLRLQGRAGPAGNCECDAPGRSPGPPSVAFTALALGAVVALRRRGRVTTARGR